MTKGDMLDTASIASYGVDSSQCSSSSVSPTHQQQQAQQQQQQQQQQTYRHQCYAIDEGQDVKDPYCPSTATPTTPITSTPLTAVGFTQTYTIVHPSGHTLCIPIQIGTTTVDMLHKEVALQWGISTAEFRFAHPSPLSADSLVEYCWGPGEAIHILPIADSSILAEPALHHWGGRHLPSQQSPPEFGVYPAAHGPASAPVSPLTPLSSPLSFMNAQPASAFPSAPSPSTPTVTPSSLENKITYATRHLFKIVNQTKHCTELQSDIETAMRMGVNCNALFNVIEKSIGELILHSAGNYLVSRCFDFCPKLIESAAVTISRHVRMYVLHKHGSYVAEAILEHHRAPSRCKGQLIANLITPSVCADVASHECGNFALQKAISCCPDHLLPHMAEAIVTVAPLTPHGAKMLKKLKARISKSPSVDLTTGSGRNIPLPASAVRRQTSEAS